MKKHMITLIALLPICTYAAFDDFFYDYRGDNPTRQSHAYEPEERFDPFTGSFTLEYTDIYLPGNGGLDLRITRCYNSNIYRDWELYPSITPVPQSWVGIGWSLHMGRLVNPGYQGCYLEMPDGSKHVFYIDRINPEQWISKDYWILRYNAGDDCWEVLFRDGIKWWFVSTFFGSFEEEGGATAIYYPTHKILDPTETNVITIYYTTMLNNETAIHYIEDACGRTINFQWSDHGNAHYCLDCINVDGDLYQYYYVDAYLAGYSRLVSVKYPDDPVGYNTYEYTYSGVEYWDEMTSRRTPYGGIYNYSYFFHTYMVGGQNRTFRMLNQRTGEGGSPIWNIYYGETTDSTIVIGPYNSTIYWMYGYNMGMIPEGENWRIGLITKKKIMSPAPCDVWIQWEYTYQPSINPVSWDIYEGPTTYDNGVYVPELIHTIFGERSVTDNNQAYIVYYNTFYDQYEYGHPKYFYEYGGQSNPPLKTTYIEYWYNLDKNILDNVSTREVWYSDVTTPHHLEEYSYDLNSGKMASSVIDGIPTTYTYDADKNIYQVTDGENKYVRYSHYTNGVADQIENEIYTTSRIINWNGTIQSETDGRGNRTSYTYDGRGRLRSIIPPPDVGNTTLISYDTHNAWKRIAKDNSYTIEFYDNYGHASRTENSVGTLRDFSYDILGILKSETFPYSNSHQHDSHIQYTHDYLGRVLTKVYASHWTEFYNYWNGGLPVVSYKDRTSGGGENHKAILQYRTFGTSFNQPLIESYNFQYLGYAWTHVFYNYNNANKLTRIATTPSYYRYFAYEPSRIGLLHSESSPERGEITYTYFNNGTLMSRKDANNLQTSYSYDAINRLTGIDYPGLEYDVTRIYDYADNLRRIETPASQRGYGYDAENRVIGDTLYIDGYTFTMQYEYDLNGNLYRVTYPDRYMVQYNYDTENRVSSMPGFITGNIQYHPSNSPEYYQMANDCITQITHNGMDIDSIIQVLPGIMNLEYNYDQADNVTRIIDHLNGNNEMTFTYDDFNALNQFNAVNLWGTGTYSYSYNNNFLRRSSESINGNVTNYFYETGTFRLDYTSGSYNYDFSYDAAGNIRRVTGNRFLTIKYDYENRPLSIYNALTRKEVQAFYDGSGTRIKRITPYEEPPKTTDDEPTRALSNYYFMTGPGGEVLYEYRSDIQAKKKYVYLNGQHLAYIDNLGDTFFYHNDNLGSPRVMTNSETRKVYSWIGYPFGKTYFISEGVDNSHRYNGKEFDKWNDLYFYGARYYMPECGIFITPEPKTGTEGLSLDNPLALKSYDYCLNNPLKYVDPNGRDVNVNHPYLKSPVCDAYRQSATFRFIYDALRRNHSIIHNLDYDMDLPTRGASKFIFRQKKIVNTAILGGLVLTHEEKMKTIAHELYHGCEFAEPNIKTEDDWRKYLKEFGIDKGTRDDAVKYCTESAQNIEKIIEGELKNKQDDIDMRDSEILKPSIE